MQSHILNESIKTRKKTPDKEIIDSSQPKKRINSINLKKVIEIDNIKDLTFTRFLNSDMAKFDLAVIGNEKKFLQYMVISFISLKL